MRTFKFKQTEEGEHSVSSFGSISRVVTIDEKSDTSLTDVIETFVRFLTDAHCSLTDIQGALSQVVKAMETPDTEDYTQLTRTEEMCQDEKAIRRFSSHFHKLPFELRRTLYGVYVQLTERTSKTS